MKVTAEVCLHCGERLYAEDVVKSFEEIQREVTKARIQSFKKPWPVFHG